MIALIVANWYLFLIAVLIGIATGWWVWAGRARVHLTGSNRSAATPSLTPSVAPTLARVSSPPAASPAPVLPPVTPDVVAPQPTFTTPEPVAAAPAAPQAFAAAPVAPAASDSALPIPPAVGAPDDLQNLKGIGPKLAALLGTFGITRFDQIAAWGASEIASVDAHLGAFKGRIVRDDWIAQAKLLAAGDVAGFEAKFGALGSER